MAILEVRGLVKYYGRRKVVDGVDFDVDTGEVVGLLGPNGAGKTTSFRMTTGQISPNQGKVSFDGKDVTALPMYRRARLGMGYLCQETSVFRRLTVEQNILAILESLPVCRSLGRALTRKERWERTETVLDQFGLTRVRKNKAARLSGGEKRRLEIARCLVCEPLLILLDEPFTGIDPITISDIQHIVRDLRKQGIGILVTDHHVEAALKITDRSYLIKDGKVRTHGTPHEIVHDPIAIKEYLGTDFNKSGIVGPDDTRPPDGSSCPYCHQPMGGRRADHAPAGETCLPGQRVNAEPADESETVHQVLEHEKIQVLVERLKTDRRTEAAAELVRRGRDAVPFLLDALERRDAELRQHAYQVLQAVGHGIGAFDPFAPEAQRRQQLAELRYQLERKAG